MTTLEGHVPDRTTWLCRAHGCGEPWPCEPERARLKAFWGPQDLALLMAPYLVEAAECPALASIPWRGLYARFVGWTRGARR